MIMKFLNISISKFCFQHSRSFHVSILLERRQKISFLDKYEWRLIKNKYLERAKYPFIPREHPVGLDVPISRNKSIFIEIDEMKPEYIVPKEFDPQLKPYVSWRAKLIKQDKLEPESLFSLTYGSKLPSVSSEEVEKFVDEYSHKKLPDSEILPLNKLRK